MFDKCHFSSRTNETTATTLLEALLTLFIAIMLT